MKFFIKAISCVLAFSAIFLLCSCSGENSIQSTPDQTSQTESVSVVPTEAETTQNSKSNSSTEFDFSNLQKIEYKDSDAMAGAWKIERLSSFVFLFDGNGNAYLIYDNVGFIGVYSYDTDENNNSFFKTQLVFGLDGSYSYEFSDDKNTATLTDSSTGEQTKMQRLDESTLSYIPSAEESPKTDEKILGAWKASDGTTVYFDKSGIMYMNEYGVKFTYSNYSVSDGKITSTYKMKNEMNDTYEYSVSGNILKLNGYKYEKISNEEL